MSLIKSFIAGVANVSVYATESEMGIAAAKFAAKKIICLQKTKKEINIIFAAAVSQNEFLNALLTYEEIEWSKINAFHMDEYHGLEKNSKDTLASFLCTKFLDKVDVKNRFFIDSETPNLIDECNRYSALLRKYPCDLVFLGIGDNGHLAFNDPHVADFADICDVKSVEIDMISKQQQVNAGNFSNIQSVPSIAYTITIPALIRAESLICVVPTSYKAQAVYNTINGEISTACPASILRTCSNANIFLDLKSAEKI